MQTFVQAKHESIVINGEIVVTVLDIVDDDVILAIAAPAWVTVCPQETADDAEPLPALPR